MWVTIIDILWVHAAIFKVFKLCLHDQSVSVYVCVCWEVQVLPSKYSICHANN